MDASLLLPIALARQRLLHALALQIPPQAFSETLLPVLTSSPLLAAATPASVEQSSPASPASHSDPAAALSHDWTAKEDALLRRLIDEHGTSKWSRIAAKMGSKSNRQCRRRWQAIMNAMGSKGAWTPEEDSKLMEGHRCFGNRWTDIARMVPGRTDNAVKNRFAALVAKGEGARSPKVKRWSEVCSALKLSEAAPNLEKSYYTPVNGCSRIHKEGGASSPCSGSSEASSNSSTCPKRKPNYALCGDEEARSMKRLMRGAELDLNAPAEGEDAWAGGTSEEVGESSFFEKSTSEIHDTSFHWDLNSPACT